MIDSLFQIKILLLNMYKLFKIPGCSIYFSKLPQIPGVFQVF